MKALSITIIIFIIFIVSPVYAAESSPSADIKAKLEELKKEIASKAAKLKQEVNRKLQNKVYIGTVKTKSATSLTLATRTGPKIVSLNQDTQFASKIKSKKLSSKTIEEEDYLVSLGDMDEQGVLTAKKIILLPTPSLTPKTYHWGQVVSTDKLATLRVKNGKNIAVSLPEPSTVKVANFVILTGSAGKNDIFKAEFVYVIPR